MNKTSLTTAALLLGTGLAAPALADDMVRPGHVPGVGLSEPASTQASNIDHADSRSTIAPRLPNPQAGDAASADQYLRDAQHALSQRKTGQAQEALERAQTRMLDRSVEQGQTGTPDADPRVQTVEQARQALGHGDSKAATRLVGQALAMNGGAAAPGITMHGGGSDPSMTMPMGAVMRQ